MAAFAIPADRPHRWLVQVCQHRSCLRNRSGEVLEAFRRHQSARIWVAESACLGQCSAGPTVIVTPGPTWYCQVCPEDVSPIVSQHLDGGKPFQERLHPRFHPPG
ncbi:MAG: ferredoxin [Nodosilinea sp.]